MYQCLWDSVGWDERPLAFEERPVSELTALLPARNHTSFLSFLKSYFKCRILNNVYYLFCVTWHHISLSCYTFPLSLTFFLHNDIFFHIYTLYLGLTCLCKGLSFSIWHIISVSVGWSIKTTNWFYIALKSCKKLKNYSHYYPLHSTLPHTHPPRVLFNNLKKNDIFPLHCLASSWINWANITMMLYSNIKLHVDKIKKKMSKKWENFQLQ